jgi:dUTP pyrophosphatase
MNTDMLLMCTISLVQLFWALYFLRPVRPVGELLYKPLSPLARTPEYKSGGAAGLDLHVLEDVDLPPGKTTTARTGIAAAIPRGLFGMVVPRGSAYRRGIRTLGIVDEDYRGEIVLMLHNAGTEQLSLLSGQAPAQMILVPRAKLQTRMVYDLGETGRGDGKFGSTGAAVGEA